MSALVRTVLAAALPCALLLPSSASAQETKSLDALLSRVKEGYAAERAALKKREAEFKASRNKQAGLLADAEKQLAAAEQRSA
ncbi:MAG: energy transducer TonB, partial [Myxococcota bacterium]